MPHVLVGPESVYPGASFALRGNRLENPLQTRYNAEADDHYDDGRLFNEALSDLHALNVNRGYEGGLLEIEPATYRVSTKIVPLSSKLWIKGSGPSTILKPSGVDAVTGEAMSLLEANGLDDLVFSDLTIDGSLLPSPRVGAVKGTNLAGSTSLRLYPGFTLQAGDTIVIDDPETLGPSGVNWEINQVLTVLDAEHVGLVQPLVRTVGDRRLVNTYMGATGGYGLIVKNANRVHFQNVTFVNMLRHGIYLWNVGSFSADHCRFAGMGQSQADQDPFPARAFGIGCYDVSQGKVTDCDFEDTEARRGAGVEVRNSAASHPVVATTDHPLISDIFDWSFLGNRFSQIGEQDRIAWSHGAGVNLVASRAGRDIRRVVAIGNRFYGIGDGHLWFGLPGGEVTANDNAAEYSVAGPFLNINAAHAAVIGNVLRTGGYSGIEIDSISTGDYSTGYKGYAGGTEGNTPGYLSISGIVADLNEIGELLHGGQGAGIIIQGGTGPTPGAHAPRVVRACGNIIRRTLQAGIQFNDVRSDIICNDNTILDANVASLARTTLTAPSVSGSRQVQVASTQWFTPLQFVQLNLTSTLTAPLAIGDLIAHVVDGSAFVVGRSAMFDVPNSQFSESIVIDAIAGNDLTLHLAATKAHASGVLVTQAGSASATIAGAGLGETRLRTGNLTGLNWVAGNAVTIGTLNTTLISVTDNGDSTSTIVLAAGLDADRLTGVAITNTTRGNASAINGLPVGATKVVASNVDGIKVGHALWLGPEEQNTAEIVVPSALSGVRLTVPATLLAHGATDKITTTYRPMVESVDDATHLTLEYMPGVWATGTSIFAPFWGGGGIAFTGASRQWVRNVTRRNQAAFSKAAQVGKTVITLDGELTALGWQNGDTLSIDGESGLTISGAPYEIQQGDGSNDANGHATEGFAEFVGGQFVVTLSAGLAAAHAVGYPAQNVQVARNRVGQERIGSTQYGLFVGSGVEGPIDAPDNRWSDCLLGGVRPSLLTAQMRVSTPDDAAFSTDPVTPGRMRMLDHAYVKARAFSTTLAVATAVSDSHITVVDDGSLSGQRGIQVGDIVWVGNVNAYNTLEGPTADTSELIPVSSVVGQVVGTTRVGGIAAVHPIGTPVSIAARAQRLSIHGPGWDNSYGAGWEMYYDPNGRAYVIAAERENSHTPNADIHLRNSMGGAVRVTPGGAGGVGWQWTAAGNLIPNAALSFDLGSAFNTLRGIFAGAFIKPPLILVVGAVTDTSIKTALTTAGGDATLVAAIAFPVGALIYNTTDKKLYIREAAATWVASAAFA